MSQDKKVAGCVSKAAGTIVPKTSEGSDPPGETRAVHTMPEGGRILIRGHHSTSTARIEVTDTGVGMTGHTAHNAFEPFFTTKPTGEGTGLGLASVASIVEQLGGTVRCESAPGEGTTIVIDLPLSTVRAARANPPPRPSSAEALP